MLQRQGFLVQTVQNTVWRYTGAVLYHRDRARSANCTEDRRFCGCSSGMVVDMPVGVPTTGYGLDSTENGGVVQRRRTWEGTHFASFLDIFW